MRFPAVAALLVLSACRTEQQGVTAPVSSDWAAQATAAPSTSAQASSAPSATAPATAGPAPSPASLLRTLCSAPNTDETSRVLVGRDATGTVIRYRVSPTQRFADMGELYFDAWGRFLGQGVAMIPLVDPKVTRELEARNVQLNGGANFTEIAKCAGQRGAPSP